MNTKNKILAGLFSMAALFSSCNDFQEINEDPNQVDESKVKPEWFLNASIVGDQMNPEIAERMFILTWNRSYQGNVDHQRPQYLSKRSAGIDHTESSGSGHHRFRIFLHKRRR